MSSPQGQAPIEGINVANVTRWLAERAEITAPLSFKLIAGRFRQFQHDVHGGRRGRPALCAAPPADGQTAAQRARRGPRTPDHGGAGRHPGAGAAHGGAVPGSGSERARFLHNTLTISSSSSRDVEIGGTLTRRCRTMTALQLDQKLLCDADAYDMNSGRPGQPGQARGLYRTAAQALVDPVGTEQDPRAAADRPGARRAAVAECRCSRSPRSHMATTGCPTA